MRVTITGDCESKKALSGYITKSGYVVSDSGDYTIKLNENKYTNVVTVDSVDCEFERLILLELERQGIGIINLKRAGGVRSDNAVEVTFNPRDSRKIEIALLNAFLKTAGVKEKKEPWYKGLFPTILFVILSSPLYAQTNFPIVRQWDSVNSFPVGAGDMVSRSLRITCISGCGGAASFNDNTAFTFGTTSIGNVGFVVDDVATNNVAENSAGTPRMGANRIIYVDLSKTGANTTALLVTGTGGSFPVTGSFLTDAQLRASAVPVDVSDSFLLDATFTGRINTQGQKAMAASTPVVIASDQAAFPITNTNLDVALSTRLKPADTLAGITTVAAVTAITNALPAGNNNIGDVDVVSQIPGTGATNLGKAEDAVPVTADTGVSILGVRTDPTTTSPVSANGDYTQIATDYVGAIPTGIHPGRFSCFVQAVTVTTQCQAAAAAGLRNYVTDIHCSNLAATVQGVDVVYGTGANCVTGITAITHKFQMGTNALTTSPFLVSAPFGIGSPLVPAAATAICVRPTAATSFGCTITGFVAP